MPVVSIQRVKSDNSNIVDNQYLEDYNNKSLMSQLNSSLLTPLAEQNVAITDFSHSLTGKSESQPSEAVCIVSATSQQTGDSSASEIENVGFTNFIASIQGTSESITSTNFDSVSLTSIIGNSSSITEIVVSTIAPFILYTGNVSSVSSCIGETQRLATYTFTSTSVSRASSVLKRVVVNAQLTAGFSENTSDAVGIIETA